MAAAAAAAAFAKPVSTRDATLADLAKKFDTPLHDAFIELIDAFRDALGADASGVVKLDDAKFKHLYDARKSTVAPDMLVRGMSMRVENPDYATAQRYCELLQLTLADFAGQATLNRDSRQRRLDRVHQIQRTMIADTRELAPGGTQFVLSRDQTTLHVMPIEERISLWDADSLRERAGVLRETMRRWALEWALETVLSIRRTWPADEAKATKVAHQIATDVVAPLLASVHREIAENGLSLDDMAVTDVEITMRIARALSSDESSRDFAWIVHYASSGVFEDAVDTWITKNAADKNWKTADGNVPLDPNTVQLKSRGQDFRDMFNRAYEMNRAERASLLVKPRVTREAYVKSVFEAWLENLSQWIWLTVDASWKELGDSHVTPQWLSDYDTINASKNRQLLAQAYREGGDAKVDERKLPLVLAAENDARRAMRQLFFVSSQASSAFTGHSASAILRRLFSNWSAVEMSSGPARPLELAIERAQRVLRETERMRDVPLHATLDYTARSKPSVLLEVSIVAEVNAAIAATYAFTLYVDDTPVDDYDLIAEKTTARYNATKPGVYVWRVDRTLRDVATGKEIWCASAFSWRAVVDERRLCMRTKRSFDTSDTTPIEWTTSLLPQPLDRRIVVEESDATCHSVVVPTSYIDILQRAHTHANTHVNFKNALSRDDRFKHALYGALLTPTCAFSMNLDALEVLATNTDDDDDDEMTRTFILNVRRYVEDAREAYDSTVALLLRAALDAESAYERGVVDNNYNIEKERYDDVTGTTTPRESERLRGEIASKTLNELRRDAPRMLERLRGSRRANDIDHATRHGVLNAQRRMECARFTRAVKCLRNDAPLQWRGEHSIVQEAPDAAKIHEEKRDDGSVLLRLDVGSTCESDETLTRLQACARAEFPTVTAQSRNAKQRMQEHVDEMHRHCARRAVALK